MLAHGRPPGSLYTSAGQRKYLTSAERVRFLETTYACPRADLRSLCLTLAFTGCRISEALELKAGSIERDAGFIAIRSLKKRAGTVVFREVPAPAELFGVLRQVHGLEDLGAQLWPLSRCRAWQLIKGIMHEAAIPAGPHATPKGLRHSFGLHAIRSGVPLNLVQRWLGHASMNTTAIYLQAIGDEEREIAARMWGRSGK
jgi:site-specific recombinase XerD